MPFYLAGLNRIISRDNGIISFIVKSKDREHIACIDEEDEYVLKRTWHASLTKKGSVGSIRANRKRRSIALHRFILNVLETEITIDHIDGNPLNNTRKNLRQCTTAQNMRNQKLKSTNTTGFKGVFRHGERFRAQIMFNYKSIHLGIFDTAEDAHSAYKVAAQKYFGEFVRLNGTAYD